MGLEFEVYCQIDSTDKLLFEQDKNNGLIEDTEIKETKVGLFSGQHLTINSTQLWGDQIIWLVGITEKHPRLSMMTISVLNING